MEIVPIELFGIHVDVPFATPLPYGKAKLDEFSAGLCNQQTGIGLRPDQLRLRRTDDLFDYELKANFFGDNGTLVRTADRVKFGIRNARTAGDWNIMHQTLVKFYKTLDPDENTVTILSSHVHARFDDAGTRDEWLRQFSHSPLIHKPAALGHVRIMDWEKDIRVLIELSQPVPNSVFIAWDTQFSNDQEWDSFLGTLPSVMENSANIFEIGFEPFKERV
jgi:hypothetical protein